MVAKRVNFNALPARFVSKARFVATWSSGHRAESFTRRMFFHTFASNTIKLSFLFSPCVCVCVCVCARARARVCCVLLSTRQ